MNKEDFTEGTFSLGFQLTDRAGMGEGHLEWRELLLLKSKGQWTAGHIWRIMVTSPFGRTVSFINEEVEESGGLFVMSGLWYLTIHLLRTAQ